MSNGQDIALHFLPLSDDKCPTLATVLDALAHTPQYAQKGDTLYPGVTLVDDVNGLVSFDSDTVAGNPDCSGQAFCVAPAEGANLRSQAKATIEYNTAFAAGSDRGVGFWLRVMPVRAQDLTARAFVPDTNAGWLANAWSFGNEFSDWHAVIEHAKTFKLPR